MKFCPLLPGEVCRIPSMCRDFLGLRPPVLRRKAKRCFHLVFIRTIKEQFNLLDRYAQHFWILWVSHLAPTIPKGCQCPTASIPYVLSHGNVPAASRLAQDIDVSGNELFLSFPADLWCLNVSFACSQRSLATGRREEIGRVSCRCGNPIFLGFLHPSLYTALLGAGRWTRDLQRSLPTSVTVFCTAENASKSKTQNVGICPRTDNRFPLCNTEVFLSVNVRI